MIVYLTMLMPQSQNVVHDMSLALYILILDWHMLCLQPDAS